jgi:FkbM family methyltransferase
MRLYEMLLEQSQEDSQTERARLREELDQERARLTRERDQLDAEILRLRSTLSWRITAPLRRLPALGQSAPGPRPAPPIGEPRAVPEAPKAPPASPTARVQPKPWRQLDLMTDALRHLHEKGFRPRVVVDVGAARGAWSQAAARVFPEAAFQLFDPLQENEPALRSLRERDPRFAYSLCALGRKAGTLAVNVGPDLDATSGLTFPGTQHDAELRSVPMEEMDGLIAAGRLPRPDLVKLDVQGFELEVLAGAAGLLAGGCVFVVEVSLFEFMPRCPLAHEVVGHFADHGYRLFDVAGLLRRPFQNDLGQMDLVFVPRDSPLIAERRWS